MREKSSPCKTIQQLRHGCRPPRIAYFQVYHVSLPIIITVCCIGVPGASSIQKRPLQRVRIGDGETDRRGKDSSLVASTWMPGKKAPGTFSARHNIVPI